MNLPLLAHTHTQTHTHTQHPRTLCSLCVFVQQEKAAAVAQANGVDMAAVGMDALGLAPDGTS
jgi:biotin synthase-related radical SAM superfamily protein